MICVRGGGCSPRGWPLAGAAAQRECRCRRQGARSGSQAGIQASCKQGAAGNQDRSRVLLQRQGNKLMSKCKSIDC
ncbi:hypothetical protein BS78_K248500 [Paspalum vaginatum]|uniref:Uncharacterized protein n=1 Tax=Paspalum vaginatum TaxID=158149 RepID=A0A9W7XBJ8_9POAL|nr:hypothetical protein BS78_K248500 [Paspalum vaginatum]